MTVKERSWLSLSGVYNNQTELTNACARLYGPTVCRNSHMCRDRCVVFFHGNSWHDCVTQGTEIHSGYFYGRKSGRSPLWSPELSGGVGGLEVCSGRIHLSEYVRPFTQRCSKRHTRVLQRGVILRAAARLNSHYTSMCVWGGTDDWNGTSHEPAMFQGRSHKQTNKENT